VRGKVQHGVGDVQGAVRQDRGRVQGFVVPAMGALIVLVVAGLLTGLLRMGRRRG